MNSNDAAPPLNAEEAVIRDFRSRMDPEYFSGRSPAEVRAHFRMAAALTPEEPVSVRIRRRGKDRFEITIVAYDTFGAFSVICGLITAFGLDILSGGVWTASEPAREGRPYDRGRLHRPQRPPARSRARAILVDTFVVRPRGGQSFDSARQKTFLAELRASALLLSDGRLDEARERIHPRLTAQLERLKGALTGLLYPIEVRFDNRKSPKWTVMEVRSKDAPAFLYAFSNALALRNIYVHQVNIRSVGDEVHDQFYIGDRHGGKVEDERRLEALKTTVALIKQFTRYLPSAPDPAKAIRHFDQFIDKILESPKRGTAVSYFRDKERLNDLARLLGTSDFLWEDFLRMQFENLFPILGDFRRRPIRPGKDAIRKQLSSALARTEALEERQKRLNEFKDREMFAVDMIHLLEPRTTLTEFSEALTDLADVVLDEAFRTCLHDRTRRNGRPRLPDGKPCAFAIFGLGKFGGREMGYASDIELMFVYEGAGATDGRPPTDNGEFFEGLVRDLTGLLEAPQEGIFHIDLRLRPYGKAGLLASAFGAWTAYYDSFGEAVPFERQALIKLRWVAGDESLGRRVESHRDRFVYSAKPWDRENALHLRERQMRELVEAGKTNVKYSAGGIIDIEYTAQYLQIQHGAKHPELRTPQTLEALARLEEIGILSKGGHRRLREAYLFLRTVIDALRMVRGNARDLILPDPASDEWKYLARRLGYGEENWDRAVGRLTRSIRLHMGNVHRIFEERFLAPAGTRRPRR